MNYKYGYVKIIFLDTLDIAKGFFDENRQNTTGVPKEIQANIKKR